VVELGLIIIDVGGEPEHPAALEEGDGDLKTVIFQELTLKVEACGLMSRREFVGEQGTSAGRVGRSEKAPVRRSILQSAFQIGLKAAKAGADRLLTLRIPKLQGIDDSLERCEIQARRKKETSGERMASASKFLEGRGQLVGRPARLPRRERGLIALGRPAEGRPLGRHHPLMKAASIKVDVVELREVEGERADRMCPVDDQPDAPLARLVRDLADRELEPSTRHHVAQEQEASLGLELGDDERQ